MNFFKPTNPEDLFIDPYAQPRKRKKVDYEALNSPFMRIPRFSANHARHLMDLGLHDVYDLVGRAPEVLFEELKERKPDVGSDVLSYFRLAVYFVENDQHDPEKLYPHYWA